MQRGVKEDGSAAVDAPENVKALPLNEQIAARLRADVLSGRLPADQRLLQEDLAARFQVRAISADGSAARTASIAGASAQ